MFCAICVNYTNENTEIKAFCEENKIVFFPITYESFNEEDEHLKVLFTWILIRKLKKVTLVKPKVRTIDQCGYKNEYQIKNTKTGQKKIKRKYSL
jgi:hypothetical protein